MKNNLVEDNVGFTVSNTILLVIFAYIIGRTYIFDGEFTIIEITGLIAAGGYLLYRKIKNKDNDKKDIKKV
jgi:hypothetical protein